MTHHINLESVVLSPGKHASRKEGVCLLELVAWWAHEPHSDHPACVDPVLGAFGRSWNDGMRTDAEREQLKPYVPLLVGTSGDKSASSRRAWMALDWSIRVSTPAWLDLAGLSEQAARLRSLPEQTAPDDDVEALLREVRSDAAAAWDAARAVARDAAWDAARDAARSAAGAAAGAASLDAPEPTVRNLQLSAHDLLHRMIAAGPHDPAALAAA